MDDKTKLDAYLENLGISNDAESSKPIIPSTPASSPIIRAENPLQQSHDKTDHAIVEDFLMGMLTYFDPSYLVSTEKSEDSIHAEITGGDSGKIIGREGRTLAAIEFLANTVLAKEVGQGALRVNVDAAGYRRRHEERLLEQARRMAARVHKSGESVELDPMTAADRRIIHIALKEDAFVMTESVGEGRERRVIIKLQS